MVQRGLGRGLNRADADSYVNAIATLSHARMNRLLVEGQEDVKFFECLRVALSLNPEDVMIQDADFLTPGGDENRRKNVEYVAEKLSAEYPHIASDFIGFADREFDNFEYNALPLSDLVNDQIQIDRLIYSRGHSIENYVFNYGLLKDALEFSYPVASGYRTTALGRMESQFTDVIRLACAMSLSALKVEVISRVSDALHHIRAWDNNRRIVYYNASLHSVELDEDEFRQRLMQEDVPGEKIRDFLDEYRHYVAALESSPNSGTERWLCHGHIGMHLLRISYAMFIYDAWNETQHSGGGTPPVSMIDTMLRRWDWIGRAGGSASWVNCYRDEEDASLTPATCFRELGLA